MPWEYSYKKLCDVKTQLNATGKADLGFIVQSNADCLKALAKRTDHINAQLDSVIALVDSIEQDGTNIENRDKAVAKLKEMRVVSDE